MGLFDIAGRMGGNPGMNAMQPQQMPMGGNRMPWGSGFEGLNGMADEERKMAMIMQMLQQQAMAGKPMQMPLSGASRR